MISRKARARCSVDTSARRSPHVATRAAVVASALCATVAAALLALGALAGMASAAALSARSGPFPGGPTPGTAVYDTAGVLTGAQRRTLEAQAAAVRQAGAAVVVYLRAHAATQAQTQQDAADLMNAWNVETAKGARDGVVLFFNLQPGNLHHGQVALFVGQRLLASSLPQTELQHISADVLLPSLRSGDLAGGIAAGLQRIAADVRYGAPVPQPLSTAQQVAVWIGRIPFNLLALLFFGWVLALALRAPRRPSVRTPTTLPADPPHDLPPALAGALVAGRLHPAQLEATILDFAHRGLLAIEPTATNKVHIRLLGQPQGLPGFEDAAWQRLRELADSDAIIPADQLPAVQAAWPAVSAAQRRDLLARGWYIALAEERRRPLYVAAGLGMLAATVGVVIAVVAGEGWALLGTMLFLVVGLGAFIRGARIPDTTAAGEAAALPWRAYRASLRAGLPLHATDDQLDAALPYAVAMGAAPAINSRHVSAAGRGYSPSWFRARDDEGGNVAHFYPYWVIFHASMYPPTSASGAMSAGTFTGGAATGGGGAGGNF